MSLYIASNGLPALENFEDDQRCVVYLNGLRIGMRDAMAAKAAGRGPGYFKRRATDDPRFAEAQEEARAEGIAWLDEHLRKMATTADTPGNFKALQLLLEQRDASYRPKTSHEIQFTPIELDETQRMARIQALLDAAHKRAADVVDAEYVEITPEAAALL